MNKQQRMYAEAKATAQYMDELQRENEKAFIQASGYVNEDGKAPTALWLIDDEQRFIELCEEWDRSPLNIIDKVKEAEAVLEKAEDALIDYALSIVPAGIRDTLNKHRRDYGTRQKLLDAAFRLDTKTVR